VCDWSIFDNYVFNIFVVAVVDCRSFALHTEAKSLNDLVVAGDLKAVTAQLNSSG